MGKKDISIGQLIKKPKWLMEWLSLAQIGYIAGFFDGEGTFTIAKKRPNKKHKEKSILYQPKVMVASTDIRPIMWLKEAVGGSFFQYSQKKEHQKDFYRWEIYGDDIVVFVGKIFPYLKIKQKQAEIVVALQNRITSYRYRQKHKGKGNGRGYAPMSVEELEQREMLYQNIRLLNKRGK